MTARKVQAPGGSSGQVQINNAGAFSGSSGIWIENDNKLNVSGNLTVADDVFMNANHIHSCGCISWIPKTSEYIPYLSGTIYFDDNDKTLSMLTDVSGTVLQIGQEHYIKIVNKTGDVLTNGTAVAISGAQGNRPIAHKVDITNNLLSHVDGVVTNNILDNQEGYITIAGLVRDIDTSNWESGADLYVSSAAGVLTDQQPENGYFWWKVGKSINSTQNGIILVQRQGPSSVANLHDVNVGTPTSGSVLIGDGSYWSGSNFQNEVNNVVTSSLEEKADRAGDTFTGVTNHNAGLSGSLTKLTDGTSYINGGTDILVTTGSDGSITIAQSFPTYITFALPLAGVTDTEFNFVGAYDVIDTSQTTDYSTPFAVGNNHIYLKVNSLTGTGDIAITGSQMSESTAVPQNNFVETVTVNEACTYQSFYKWWDVVNIQIPAGISAINYDIGVVGYPDLGNEDFKFVGYRVEATAQGPNADFGFEIYKVQDDGDKKMTLVTLESIGIDSNNGTNQIVDSLRTGSNDRSFNPTVASLWPDNRNVTFKQGDFDSYFTSNENHFESSTKDEGIIIKLRGEDGSGSGSISNVDFIHMWGRLEGL